MNRRAVCVVIAIIAAVGAQCKRASSQRRCNASIDCDDGQTCLFPDAGCGDSAGRCGEPRRMLCADPNVACGCDGRSVVTCPAAERPWSHAGPCAGQSPTSVASTTGSARPIEELVGKPCKTKADCAGSQPGWLACAIVEPGCDSPRRECRYTGQCHHAVMACGCNGKDIDICPSTTEPYSKLGRCGQSSAPDAKASSSARGAAP